MVIATVSCDWKCLKEQNLDTNICHNSHTAKFQTQEEYINILIGKYLNNLLSESIIFAGLEPMFQFEEIYNFINEFRKLSNDDIVIYTGYYPNEIIDKVNSLKKFNNIIIKFGRYILNSNSKYDEILKVNLASDNQWAEKIS